MDGKAPPAAAPYEAAALFLGCALLAGAVIAAVIPEEWAVGRPGALRVLPVAPLALGLAAVGLLVLEIRERPALLAAFLSAAATLLLAAYYRRPDGPGAWDGDAASFYRMAEEWPWRPGGWWRYRVLVPWAVSLLPGSVNAGYLVLGAIAVAACGPLLSLLLADLGFGAPARHAGLAIYLASFAPLYNCSNYALPDPAALAILLLAARALVRGRDWEFAAWLALGVATKEVVLFLVPVRWLWGGGALRSAALAAPAAAVFLALRLAPGEAGSVGGLAGMSAWLFPWRHQPDNLARLFSPFGAGWALVLLGCLAPSRWLRAGWPFAAAILACLLVTDAGRILVYLLPFAVPAMLEGAGLGPSPIPGRSVAAIALVVLSLRLWDPFLVFGGIPPGIRRGAALLLVPAVLWLARRPRAPGAAPDR